MSARKTVVTVASAAALASALPAIKAYEGYSPKVVVDTIGTGRPCTGGYGETEHVTCGEIHDEKYWSDRLAQRLPEYDRKIGKCITAQVPDKARAALISAAYNAGPAAVCRSPMVAKMNAGDIHEGCDAFAGWYIRAQGRVVQGLVNRRAKERKLCMESFEAPRPAVVAPSAPTHPAPAPAKPRTFWSWVFK